MIVGFDLDGVIADHTVAKIKLADNLGWKITEKDTPSEILENVLPHDILEKLRESLYGQINSESFLMNGAKETLGNISKENLPFFLISKRHHPPIAIEFLKKEKLWPDYFNESNSFFVVEKEDKDTKAKELGITHYFDDEAGVLKKLKSVNNKFLFDGHNVFPEKDFYTKVSSWDDIKKQLHL